MIDNYHFGRLVVAGDVMVDRYISGAVKRLSPEAPVPVLLRSGCASIAGGAANVAANAAALGCQITLIGVVGDDENADNLRDVLRVKSNIDTSQLVTEAGWSTISKTRVLSGQHQLVRIDDERVVTFSDATQDELIKRTSAALENADVLVCSDYAKGVLTDRVLRAMIAAAQARSIPIIIDPKRVDFSAYRGATLVTPNSHEAAAAAGLTVLQSDADAERAAAAISAQFGGDVLLTRSEKGMTLWQRNGVIRHEAVFKSEVFDVSGAGDTVLAAVAAVLSAGHDLETATVIATAAASIAVSKLGTSMVSRRELNQKLVADTLGFDGVADLATARGVVEDWRLHGARIAFTNGCFDLLHPGHIALIRAASMEGDKLVVGLNSDDSIRRLKGAARPVQPQEARAAVMSALRDVDLVVIFEEDTPQKLIETLRPDTIIKGADYRKDEVVGGDFVKSYGGHVVLAKIIDGCSTTDLIARSGQSASKASSSDD